MKTGLMAAVMIVLLSGCSEPGMNIKRASVDAGSGMTVVGVLQNVPQEKFEATKAKIIEISTDLLGFIDTGSLAQLPLDQVEMMIESYMIKRGWGQYDYIVSAAFSYIKTKSINLQPIGENNIELIKIALKQTIVNAQRSTLDGR